ncbi:MAG: hypothetical protein DRQ49_06140 [Gammaproteobacteria bacterium]|nr:MAG: hypothetical protein DRQ49_06140 [Gammaproteobacteria bacterium]RKZ44871.1 MAG: hypothetical protein DRQ41_01760 [Gammaproteobacteria bacterium]RKZ74607.1 MAG: hypothetical protein DRQ57_10480 [Gammaproteobacteria bacterium]
MKVENSCGIKTRGITLLTVTAVLSFPQIAMAYVGPGAGLTLIGSLIGLVIAILTALGIILFWPVRALIRRIRGKQPTKESENVSENVQETSPESVNKKK